MMQTFWRMSILLAVAALLSACLLGGAEKRYRLIAPQVEAGEALSDETSALTLAIARPQADRTRDSTRILVRRDRVLLPWPEAAWIDRAPDLVQDLLVAYLDGRVATVGRYGSLPADYRLELVVTRFELADRADGLQADVAIVARLFEASGRLLATTRAEGRTPASGTSLEDAVAAMEAGMGQVFGELAGWLHDRLDGRDAG